MEHITSRQNPFFVQLRKLNRDRSERRKAGLFSGEGPKLLREAIRAGVPIETIILAQDKPIDCPKGTRQILVPTDLLEHLSDTKTPQGVIFLCRIPDTVPPEVLPGSRYLVLDGLQDPGNVGTIWRTADALGADGLILTHHCADPFAPKTVRATMGACFRLPVYEVDSEQLPALLERSRLPLYATALREDTVDIREASLERCAVVIGSEGRGISEELLSYSQKTLKIPMRERCESLNAAIAASIVLWEMKP